MLAVKILFKLLQNVLKSYNFVSKLLYAYLHLQITVTFLMFIHYFCYPEFFQSFLLRANGKTDVHNIISLEKSIYLFILLFYSDFFFS